MKGIILAGGAGNRLYFLTTLIELGIRKTVSWYLENQAWVKTVLQPKG